MSVTLARMTQDDYERQQVERFRRAAERELEIQAWQRTFRRRVTLAVVAYFLASAGVAGCWVHTNAQP